MSEDVLRLFIALHLPEAVCEALEETGRQLARRLPAGSVRWVPAQRMHLTLLFLGATAATRLPALQEAVTAVAALGLGYRPVLGPLGCFPNPRHPHVFWAGLEPDPTPLRTLQAALVDHLAPLGWTPDPRPFNPHITLGRVRRGAQMTFPDQPPTPPPLSVDLDRIQLYSSISRADGPRYTLLHSARLRSLA